MERQSSDAGFTEVRLKSSERNSEDGMSAGHASRKPHGRTLRSSAALTIDPSKLNNLVQCHGLQWELGTKVAFSVVKVKRVVLKLILLTELYSLIDLLVAKIFFEIRVYISTHVYRISFVLK
jgi:hypothetical protein